MFWALIWAYVRQPDGHIGWVTVMPFASINPTNPRTNPWTFHKKYWELSILKNALFWVGHFDFFFAFFPWKLIKVYWLARMGPNFDDYLGFQPIVTPPKHFSRQCSTEEIMKPAKILVKPRFFLISKSEKPLKLLT